MLRHKCRPCETRPLNPDLSMKRRELFAGCPPLAAIALGLLLFTGCGGPKTKFFNQDYLFEKPADRISLGILPSVDDPSGFSDSVLADAFSDSLGRISIIEPNTILESLATDTHLVSLINQIGLSKVTKSDTTHANSLRSILTDDGFHYLQGQIDHPDLLLFPIVLSTKNLGVVVMANSRFRLYDLKSSELIYETEDQVNVEHAGDQGDRVARLFLIWSHLAQFDELFWKRFVDPAGL